MKTIQYGKLEGKTDLRKTLFITDTHFIVATGHVSTFDVNAKNDFNSLIVNLTSIENNNTFVTVNYLTSEKKSKSFCISDLVAVNFQTEKNNQPIDSLLGLFKYIGETYFTSQATRKETLIESLLSSFINIVYSIVGLAGTYVIWVNPSWMYEINVGNGIRATKKNFIFGLLGKLVEILGTNIAGGLFLALFILGIYLIIKRIKNSETYQIYIK